MDGLCVWASPLAGNLHLTSSTLLLSHSILPFLPLRCSCNSNLSVPITNQRQGITRVCTLLLGTVRYAWFSSFFSDSLSSRLRFLNLTVFICPLFLLLLFLRLLSVPLRGSQGDKSAPGWAKCAYCWEPDGTGRGKEGVRYRCHRDKELRDGEAAVWHSNKGELALHSNNLLELMGFTAAHKLRPQDGLTLWERLVFPNPSCKTQRGRGGEERRAEDDVKLSWSNSSSRGVMSASCLEYSWNILFVRLTSSGVLWVIHSLPCSQIGLVDILSWEEAHMCLNESTNRKSFCVCC